MKKTRIIAGAMLATIAVNTAGCAEQGLLSNYQIGSYHEKKDIKEKSESVQKTSHNIEFINDTTFNMDGLTVSIESDQIESIVTDDDNQEILLKTENGVYLLQNQVANFLEITEDELRDMYKAQENAQIEEIAGEEWILADLSKRRRKWQVEDPATKDILYRSYDNDVYASASQVYINSDGDVSVRTIGFASNSGDAPSAVTTILRSIENYN